MKYLLDTDTCVYFFNGEICVRDRLHEVGVENACLCWVTLAELRYGAHKSTRVQENLDRIQILENHAIIFNRFDSNLANLFGKLKSELKSKGMTIGDFDLLIACFALTEDAVLVSNNISHFKNIPNLRLENWRNA